MRRLLVTLVAFVFALVGGVALAQPASAVSTLFVDNFSGAKGAKPDASKWSEWSACTYNGSAAYGKIGCGERATLDGQGHLSIPATPGLGTSISTKDHSRFVTGTFTARMKIPSQAGYWPAFWLLNNNPNGAERTPTIGEVDVHESYTGLDKTIHHAATHNYVTKPKNTGQDWGTDNYCRDGVDLSLAFHDYGVKVEPNLLTYTFDGKVCATEAKSDSGGKPWAFAPDNTWGLWPILTLAVGGAGGQQDGQAVQPAVLLVDSVKVTR